jgi:hypothetical protein
LIDLHPLRLTFRPDAGLTLPRQPGTLWRSAIGARLRADACITGADNCAGCRVAARCDYARLYEPAPPERGVGRHFRQPPRPWVLAPTHGGSRLEAGDPISLDLVVTAGGFPAWPALRHALERLRLGPARLELIEAISRTPAPEGEPAPRELTGHRPDIPAVPEDIRVLLESPLRLQREGRPLGPEELDAPAFLGALLRRLDALGAPAPDGGGAVLMEHARTAIELREPRLSWRQGERTSHRQGRRIPLDGITGEFRLSGDLSPLWSRLWTGQWTHVGKVAVMGLGRYRLLRD